MTRTAFGPRGFKNLDRQLAGMMQGLPIERQRAILHEGAQIVVHEAKRLAPYLTGNLRDSIASVDTLDGRIYGKLNGGTSIYIGPVGSTEDGDVYYAKFQEFGWLDNPGSPFMRPAIASKRPEAERLILARLRAETLDQAR